ncbi:hypothetical protein FQN53_008905 [Emmonsiellopsis sp. PD_33]|nr:hypothetical protein FQN53_008905 [Emmonsiellopsis sp. PD_33]
MNSSTHPNAYYGATTRPRLSPSDYTVACICPMGVELAPMEAMLDQIHATLPTKGDNTYTFGFLGGHNIVVAVMPEPGNNRAASVATQLLNDFRSIRFALLVGVAGGIPEEDNDIRLGDIVVSKPTGQSGGVIQFDMGKVLEGGQFQRTGQLNKPPAILSANVQKLKARHLRKGSQILSYFNAMLDENPHMRLEYQHPSVQHGLLSEPELIHQGGNTCGSPQILPHTPSMNPGPRVHYGTIGSSNTVIKDPVTRDNLGQDMGILCVEMEAAGLMDAFPCLVIRGICDYADSHKNKRWQPYAAAMAAAYAKELLMIIPAQEEVKATPSVQDAARQAFRLGLHLGDAPAVEPHLFIGRKPELERMEAALKPNARGEERRIVVLGGTGGIGKTQLAIAFAKRYRENYDSVFWLNATSQGTLHASLHQLAQHIFPLEDLTECDDDRILSLVSRWLSETGNTRWLLIFDNYDEPDQYSIRKYYPSASHGSIITTTRLPDKVMGFSIKVQHLDRLEDGLDILQTRSGRSNVKSDLDAKRLAERLNGFPLALATAGAFLRNNSIPFKTYLDKYEEQWNIVPNRPTKLPEYKESDTLYTTWGVSFTRLQEVDFEAAQLLTLLAYFDNKAIWYDLLRAGISETSLKWLTTVTEDYLTFASTMNRLVEYCFVESHNEADSYSIHPCVHDWILHRLNEKVDENKYRFALDCISLSIPPTVQVVWQDLKYRPLTFHAVRLCHPRLLRDRDLDIARGESLRKSVNIGHILYGQGQFRAASGWLARLLQCCNESTCAALAFEVTNLLGLAFVNMGKLDEAEKLYTQLLNKMVAEFGPAHKYTFSVVGSLGRIYSEQGRQDEAEEKLNRALEGCEHCQCGGDILDIDTLAVLGDIYESQGNLFEAEKMVKHFLEEHDMPSGESDIATLRECAHLGRVYTKLGNFVEAENALQRALQGVETKLSADHFMYFQVARSYGELCWKQGKLAEAEKLLECAFQGYQNTLGLEESMTIDLAHRLCDLYLLEGKTEAAKKILELCRDLKR